ncbi:MAG: protein kinase [Gammaproteobacteria bacterium]|nr:protein kinase [Gammaproteobacteria bacterium]
MKFIRNIQAQRLLDQIMAASDPTDEATAKIVDKAARLGGAAVPKVYEQLEIADKKQMVVLVDLLARLLNDKNLDYFVQGLAHAHQKVVQGVSWAMISKDNFDPNRLLAHLGDPKISKAGLIEVLRQHKERLRLSGLMQQAYGLDETEKRDVMRIVGEIADESLVPDLISRTSGKDTTIREQIVRILGRFNRPDVQQALQRQLMDSEPSIREAALDSLKKMDGDLDVKVLCGLLLDGDVKIQGKAVDLLIKVNHPDTTLYLLDALKDDSEYARRAAVEVLNEVGNAGSIKQLLSAVQDEDWWVRGRAADALAKIGGPKVVDAVLELIRDDDESIRRAAIEILNATKDERAFDHLVEALEDSDWWVRERAVDALAEIGNPQAVPALMKMLKKRDQAAPVVVRALAKLGSHKIVSELLALAASSDKTLKVEALKAVGQLTNREQSTKVKQHITRLVSDELDDVKTIAVEAIARIDARMAKPRDAKRALAEETAGALKDDTGAHADASKTLLVEGEGLAKALEAAAKSRRLDISKLSPGEVLENRYKYVQRIGKGAFGTVLLMEDTAVDEEIILKFLNAQIASDEEMMQRFVHELRYSRKITHPNVIRIYDFLSIGGLYAISMEYFPSHTLGAELVDDEPLELNRVLKFSRDIAAGMTAAHGVGIVHRDLKPANILINDEGILKVVDFGVAAAQSANESADLTKTGYVIGSPKYMAPEQILGKKVAETSDIYSTGVIMYEMLTGKPPYTKGDHMAVMYQHVQGGAPEPKAVNPDIPDELNDVVVKCMALAPEDRHQTMEELVSIFDDLMARATAG